MCILIFFLFKQKTAYEMRISDWSSDVCSSDLAPPLPGRQNGERRKAEQAVRALSFDCHGAEGEVADDAAIRRLRHQGKAERARGAQVGHQRDLRRFDARLLLEGSRDNGRNRSGIIRRFVADGAGVVRAVAHRGGENHDRPLRATVFNKGQVLQRSGVADRMLGRLLPPMVPLARLETALPRSEEHTSAIQSLMRTSYAVFCLNNNKLTQLMTTTTTGHNSSRSSH